MILKAITLENFKGIREPVRIELAPVTLLFGPNNAGKSTVVQALMYACEVLERNNCDAGRTMLGGDVIDLGGFANLVHGHDLSRVIRMRFEMDLRHRSHRHEADWVREAELDSNVWHFYSDAPQKLDIQSAERLLARLVDVWVEIEIAWSEVAQRPLVRTYSVGTGLTEYARITLDAATREASLSYFNFGVYPFGTRYDKGDCTDFEWEFAKEARKWLRQRIASDDCPDLGLRKDAHVGMAEEEIGEYDNRLARHVFDEILYQIIAGDGHWGDGTVDEETGEHKPQYAERQRLMRLAEMRERLAKAVAAEPSFIDWLPASETQEADGSNDAADTGKQDGGAGFYAEPLKEVDVPPVEPPLPQSRSSNEDEPRDDGWEDRIERASCGDDYEVDSWLLELFVALIRDDFIPFDSQYALPLPLKGSALPEWGRTLGLDYRVWRPDKWVEFWEFPAFAQEWLKDLLTVAIAKPGESLLRALEDAVYLSPFRAMPPRHYQPARSPDPRRWADGLAAWDWLLLEGKPFAARVNQWLSDTKRFNSGYEIDLRHYREVEVDSALLDELMRVEIDRPLDRSWVREQLEKVQQGRRLQIKNLRNGLSLFPQDLGVGVSQVVPVIVAALHQESGIVAIEEPESNIHPAFQVVLADLFVTQAKANPEALFLIETHSEHLMLRCLRRIRETTDGELPEDAPALRPEDIAVHFVEPDEDGQPRIHRIRIDENGEFLDPWPRGFFRERAKELYGDDL